MSSKGSVEWYQNLKNGYGQFSLLWVETCELLRAAQSIGNGIGYCLDPSWILVLGIVKASSKIGIGVNK